MTQYEMKKHNGGKLAAVIALFAGSTIITMLGAGFAVYSILNGVSFKVLNADIPGFIFAAVVIFLGVRFFLSTMKMSKKLEGKEFSWSNFKKQSKSK